MSTGFYDPSVPVRKTIHAAPRPIDLRGKVVGLYDNTKEQADIILAAIGDLLTGVRRQGDWSLARHSLFEAGADRADR